MDTTVGLYPRRRASGRTWLALGVAAAAVVLLVAMIAVACRADGGTPAGLGDSPSPAADTDAAPIVEGGDSEDDIGPGGDDGAGSGDGAEDAEEPGDGSGSGGGPGSGDGSGGDPGSGEGPAVLQGYEQVREQHAVGGNEFLRTTVRCPAGKVAISGGVRKVGPAENGSPIVMQESGPGTVGGGAVSLWLVSLRNTAAENRIVELRAVCVEPPPGYEVVGETAAVASGDVLRRIVACPAGTVALGGGAQVVGSGTGDFRTNLLESAPDVVSGSATTWAVAVRNNGGQERSMGFRAVCAEAPSGYEVIGSQVTVDGDEHAGQAANCPAGTLVVGGGVGPTSGLAVFFYPALRESYPFGIDASRWVAHTYNWAVTQTIVTRAICAHVQ
jgi:hypothetical protein